MSPAELRWPDSGSGSGVSRSRHENFPSTRRNCRLRARQDSFTPHEALSRAQAIDLATLDVHFWRDGDKREFQVVNGNPRVANRGRRTRVNAVGELISAGGRD